MTGQPTQVAVQEPALARTLGTWSGVAVVVGTIIGSGIFRVPGPVAAGAGSTGSIVILWVLGGLIALCGALSLAELSAAFPRTGGMYVFLRETYGGWAAFLFGWAMLFVNPAAYAFVAMVFAESLALLVPALEGLERIVAAVSLIALALLNIRPVRLGATLLGIATWLKVAVLVVLSLVAIALVTGDAPGSGSFELLPETWPGFGLALILVMGAYDGWQWVPQIAGEMRDPQRSIPRALLFGVSAVILVYLLANVANMAVLSLDELSASTLVTVDVASRVLGAAGISIVAATIVVSTLSSNHAGFITDPRVLYAMAEDGLFFRRVAAVHPRHRTPWVAILLIGGVAVFYLFVRTVEELIATLVLGMWPFLALSVASLIILRSRRPDLERPFRVPLYPFVPLFFLIACFGIFANSFREQPLFTAINFAALGAGLPLYWLWRARAAGANGA